MLPEEDPEFRTGAGKPFIGFLLISAFIVGSIHSCLSPEEGKNIQAKKKIPCPREQITLINDMGDTLARYTSNGGSIVSNDNRHISFVDNTTGERMEVIVPSTVYAEIRPRNCPETP